MGGAAPTLTLQQGQAVEAIWPDTGNVARATFFKAEPLPSLDVNFKVTENLCTGNGIGKSFTLKPGLALPAFTWLWKSHRDATKIGQPLKADGQFRFASYLLTSGAAFLDPSLTAGLPGDVIEFNDVGWIPGMEDGVLKSMTLDAWNTDGMITNPETGVQEEATVASEYGMKFEKTGDHTVCLLHSNNTSIFAGQSAHNLLGDAVYWILRRNGQICQISFGSDQTGVSSAVSAYLGSLQNKTPENYVWGQDKMPLLVPNFFEVEFLARVEQ